VPQSLGERLRTARESKGLSIEQVAAVTKLNSQFIEALEEGRWDLLPGRVYLKSFAKVYAEALGIDVKEVYEKIDGQTAGEKAAINVTAPPGTMPDEKKVDYKLPVVLAAVVLVIIVIIMVVRSRKEEIPQQESETFVPARTLFRRTEKKWERPWERPVSNPMFSDRNRFTLETFESEVWACVVADEDTVFKSTIPPNSGESFAADSAFKISLSRNDKVAGYLNGLKVAAIGGSSKKIYNLLIRVSSGDSTGNEIK
jgi:transcriptional regulator with XRE-family HTH domain